MDLQSEVGAGTTVTVRFPKERMVQVPEAEALDRRPRLAAALAMAKKLKCPVLVAKLDRLSRDVAFIAGLMAKRVPLAM